MAEKKETAKKDDVILVTDIDPDPTSKFMSNEPRDGTKASEGPVPTLDKKAAAALEAAREEERAQGAIRAEERKNTGSDE